MMQHRTPTYFLSHGGPTLIEDTEHPAYAKLQEIGQEITTKVKPKAVIVFSAHWQGEPGTIEINAATTQDLIYDFYGFPRHLYAHKFPNTGSPELARRIQSLLGEAGIKSRKVSRGLDHGVWVSFSVAFNPQTNPLQVPLVQVSLYGNENPVMHYKLGKALETLRNEEVLIIGSGMAVHNLRDFRRSYGMTGAMPYAKSFDVALKQAAEVPSSERETALATLLTRSDARQAHPTFEHLLPVHIAAGAAGDDSGKQLWTLPEGSLSWAMYRFGEVAGAA
ncbi:hypothetical protein AMS68_006218 [Peltaster fructicola]|uniref:Extradiol ring-cleavage dioxygenase class III enzyme subunit B domain-containing protein n=1 Tax=Peltaster fructicola TaxID=286661 RepID=A0A6H0Y1A2_9PEZI|nr:hypothetical protein AMS68_006218 [Peltaster fructicola]